MLAAAAAAALRTGLKIASRQVTQMVLLSLIPTVTAPRHQAALVSFPTQELLSHNPPCCISIQKRWSPHVGCSRCGRTSHRVEDCFATSHADGSLIARLDSSQFHDDSAHSRSHVGINLPANANKLKFIAANLCRSSGSDIGACARCGRCSHKSSECFAATHARELLLNHSSRFDEHAGGKRRRA